MLGLWIPAVLLLEYWFTWFPDDDDEDLEALLDFLCLEVLDVDPLVVANGSMARFDFADTWLISASFSGDEGESLEFASCVMGLYGGIGFTLPPFFCKKNY